MTRFLILLIVLASQACKPTTQLQVIRPAAITIPDHIEVLGIIDRSKPRSGFVNVLEGGATGEAFNQDRNGRLRAIEALNETLSRTPRFRVVDTGEELTGTETGSTFADPLRWRRVDQICRQHDVDALISLEKFDSNNSNKVTSRKRKKKTDDGEIEETVWDAEAITDVEIGWRVYDPETRTIVDEVSVNDKDTDRTSGKESRAKAVADLENPRVLTLRVSERAGRKYAERIAPLWITLSRTFYKKAKGRHGEEMAHAARLFEAESWPQAETIWLQIVDNSLDDQVKGMAAYNLAVFHEKTGRLNLAMEWAQRAYGDYANKKAKGYLVQLRRRIAEQERLNRQLRSRT